MRISDWSSDVCASDLCASGVRCASSTTAMACPPRTSGSRCHPVGGVTPGETSDARAGFASGRLLLDDYSRRRILLTRMPASQLDRKSVESGKGVSVRVDLGGRPIIKKKKYKIN